MLESEQHPLLDAHGRHQLAEALGDREDTAIEVHSLQRGLGRAFALGPPSHFRAALVEAGNLPAEPHGFAADPSALCDLLEGVRGWHCVLVDRDLADPLKVLVQQRIAPTVRRYESVHLALQDPVREHRHPAVRLLGLADLPLVQRAPGELRPDGFATLEESLAEGAVAGAVVEEDLVAFAHVDALTPRFGEISVHTLAPWRGQGMASCCATLVARELQRRRRVPVWYTGWDNAASLRVAAKLGFCQVSRPVYLIRN